MPHPWMPSTGLWVPPVLQVPHLHTSHPVASSLYLLWMAFVTVNFGRQLVNACKKLAISADQEETTNLRFTKTEERLLALSLVYCRIQTRYISLRILQQEKATGVKQLYL